MSAPSKPRRIGWLLAALLVVLSTLPGPAAASTSPEDFEQCLLELVNQSRAAAGRDPVAMAPDVGAGARSWSAWMSSHVFRHMTTAEREAILPPDTFTWAENIAHHSSPSIGCSVIHEMFMNSPGHRSNILHAGVAFVGLGAHLAGDGWWVTEVFFDATGYPCKGTFCDDDGSAFETSIERVAAAGITRGCNPPANTRFCPNDYVTRGQLAAFLDRALDLAPATSPTFSDTVDSIFRSDITRLAAAGITKGCNPPANTRFCPDDHVTRGQFAAFFSRALGLPAATAPTFDDTTGSIFRSDITRLAAAGITRGCNPPANTRFCPDDYVTRGQLAAFLDRALSP